MSASTEWYPAKHPASVLESGGFGRITEDRSVVSVLRQVSRLVCRAVSLEQGLAELVEHIASAVRCDSCLLYVLDGDDLLLKASKNPPARIRVRVKQRVAGGIGLAEQGEPTMIAQNAHMDPRFLVFNESGERFESFLSLPLLSRGRLVGVLNLQNRVAHRYNECELGLLATLAALTASGIEMSRMEGEISQLAQRLELRKVVERAKGILQAELTISEQEAYLVLQRQSQQRRRPMKEIAEAIILSHDVKRRS